MQSLSRAIKRGNAHLRFNKVTKQVVAIWKRGTTKKVWNSAVKEALPATEENYCTQAKEMQVK